MRRVVTGGLPVTSRAEPHGGQGASSRVLWRSRFGAGSLCAHRPGTQFFFPEDFPGLSFRLQHCPLALVSPDPSLPSGLSSTLRISLSPFPINVSKGSPSFSAPGHSLNITPISISRSYTVTLIYLLTHCPSSPWKGKPKEDEFAASLTPLYLLAWRPTPRGAPECMLNEGLKNPSLGVMTTRLQHPKPRGPVSFMSPPSPTHIRAAPRALLLLFAWAKRLGPVHCSQFPVLNPVRKAPWALGEGGNLSLRTMDSLCLFGNMLINGRVS